MTTYHVWAEHTAGQSVGHPCRTGTFDDPADKLDFTVEANDETDAGIIGRERLKEIVADFEPCACGRSKLVGNDRWWDSVAIIASRTPYPDYTGDDAFGHLHDYQTGECLRPATREEREASDAEVAAGRQEGVIPVDWRSDGGWQGEDFRRCYVMP